MRFLRPGFCLASGGILAGLIFSVACAHTTTAVPIDLRLWKLTLPVDENADGKVDEIGTRALQNYSHPEFFFVDQDGFLIFRAPNKAATTANSTNTRSELRQMYRGVNTKIGTHDPLNNFALQAHRRATSFAAIGGQLEATLKILHVSKSAKYPHKEPAFSVVIGQIHAGKNKQEVASGSGFGWGNEPLKIFYKKWPDHKTGSVFWAYERNLAKDNPDRTDITYPVWGNNWDNPEDPGDEGIALGELFNYNVNVHANTMYLTFRTTDPSRTVTHQINLANNVDANGQIDEKDHPGGYAGDSLYFKAGAYNQCSVNDAPSFRYPACPGTGDWETDGANGDYVSVAFRRIQLTQSVDPTK